MAFTHATHYDDLYKPLHIPETPARSSIDVVQNAFVLRADLHSQFDDYQFGFETYSNGNRGSTQPRLRIFEKSGAPSLPRNQVIFLPKAAHDAAPDVNPLLLTQHFLTGLLWHVAGNGLKAHTNAVNAAAPATIHTGHD
ncbi:hypothetical protein B0H12DRAFT_1229085 [Mycena haematopus]|nr:hypothetical protein B0H12DRAFT_1229085 [Mycena haematopus]